MAPAATVLPQLPKAIKQHLPVSSVSSSRQSSLRLGDNDATRSASAYQRRLSMNKKSTSNIETSALGQVIYTLKRRSSTELGSQTSATLLDSTHDSLLNWIRVQRMNLLPNEGSSYDRVLAWAQILIERLYSLELAIDEFSGDGHVAAQLAYGYCDVLLKLGPENAEALKLAFGLCQTVSAPLANLTDRAEQFHVSEDVSQHLVTSLSSLVTLVAGVATYFHRAISGSSTITITDNLYGHFHSEIRAFTQCYEKTTEAIWKYQVSLTSQGQAAEELDGQTEQLQTIKTWLSPEDPMIGHVMDDLPCLANGREELSCLWIGPVLARFMRGHMQTMSLYGVAGSGKTMLSSVLVDYLQNPLGRIKYDTLYMSIDRAAPTETTLGEVAKTLLAQLFEKRIGDVELFDILTTACETSRSTTEVSSYDDLTWDALERALAYTRPTARELVLVVDGIDAAYGGEEVLMNRLVAATSKATNVKLITLGAEKRQNPGSLEMSVQITEDAVYDDVVAVTRRHLGRRVPHFSIMNPMDQEMVASRIAMASGGSFLWAKLAVESLRGQKSSDDIIKASDEMPDSQSVSIKALVQQTLSASEMKRDTKLALVWLARARRPLSLREFGTLIMIQPDQNKLRNKQPDVMAILEPISHLVSFRHGTVSLAHDSTRAAVLDILHQGKWVSNFGDGHKELVTRLLSYTKMTLAQHHQQHPEPSLSLMSDSEISQLVGRFPLLDYAARHWPAHLMSNTSILTNHDECLTLAKSMTDVFPSIPSALVLQSTLWQKTVPTVTMLPYQTVVYNMCRQLFTADHPTTIQAMINLSMLYRESGMVSKSIDLLYEVITTTQKVLSPRHPLTLQVSQFFLELTDETSIFLERRETVMLLMVECYKAQHGHTSEMVVTMLNQLVQHYKLVGSDTKVQETIELIRATTETEYGTYDTEHNRLKLQSNKQPVVPQGAMRLDLDMLETDETLKATSSYESFDVELSLRQAEKWSDKKAKLAEQKYLETWQRASKVYQTHRSDIWEERKLQAGLAYSKFLKKQNKDVAAASVLSSIWEEYSHTETTTLTEKLSQKLTEVASAMKSVGLQSEALSLLKQCSSYYENRHSTQSIFYQEIQKTIEISSKELMESLSSSGSNSASWTATSEATLEQTVLDSCRAITTSETATTAVHAVWSLTDRYTANRRWQTVSTFLNKVLLIIWPALLSPTMQELSLPKPALDNLLESCVDMAERLCESFHVRRHLTVEQDIRVRLYRSLRSGRPVEDALRKRVTARLLALFKTTSQKDAAIQIQRELLNDLTAHHGPEHPIVLQSLWDTAELVRPRPMFIEYYQQIVRILNKDTEMPCVPSAFEPVSVIAFQLWGRGQHFDALPYYRTLFETFIENPGLNPKLQDHVFVHEMFERYTSCLRADSTNLGVLHQATTRYRQQCTTIFGAQSSISVKATLTLAGLCQESKQHEAEAIDLYNELLESGTHEINRDEITTIVEAIYEEQAAMTLAEHSESSSKSRTYTERSIKMLSQRIETVRQTGGWAQDESLTMLSEMVRYQISQGKTQEVVTQLREATTNILLTETNSSRLVQAASTIASNFMAADQLQEARQLREELYTQMVLKTAAQTETTMTGTETLTNLSMESLIFLAEFECRLRHTGATVSEVLATLITEYTHLSEFRSLTAVGSSASLRTVLLSTARLDRILRDNHQQEEDMVYSVVLEHLTRYFIEAEGRAVGLTDSKQVDILLKTLIRHVDTHECTDVVRSVAISGYNGVVDLVQRGDHECAYNLAHATFTYVTHHMESYRTPAMSKMILVLGLAISGFTSTPSNHLPVTTATTTTNNGLVTAHSPPLSPKSTISPSSPQSPTFINNTSTQTPQAATTTTTTLLIPVPTKLQHLSSTILQSVLPLLLNDLSADLTTIPLPSLTHILSILASSSPSSDDTQQQQQQQQTDYHHHHHPHRTLSHLLSDLWARRAMASAAWGIPATLALGRCHVVSRFLVGDSAGAARLAESLTYNCRRVIGGGASSGTMMGGGVGGKAAAEDGVAARGVLEEQSVFLTRLYSSIALRYMQTNNNNSGGAQDGAKKTAAGGDRAGVYLRKSAAVHETALRALVDPEGAAAYGVGDDEFFSSIDGDKGSSSSRGGSIINGGGDVIDTSGLGGGGGSGRGEDQVSSSNAFQAKRHMQLLKLAVQRLGDWPNDFKVYEQLSESVCDRFSGEGAAAAAQGGEGLSVEVDGAAQWKVHDFGHGKAESDEDVLDLAAWSWDLGAPPSPAALGEGAGKGSSSAKRTSSGWLMRSESTMTA